MSRRYNPNLTHLSRSLRKNSTKEEDKLWYQFLNKYRCKFRRQYVIGNYIVDFYCAEAQLVIELDGSQHYEPGALIKDQIRTEYIERYGIEVLRFSNDIVVKQFDELKQYLDYYILSKLQHLD